MTSHKKPASQGRPQKKQRGKSGHEAEQNTVELRPEMPLSQTFEALATPLCEEVVTYVRAIDRTADTEQLHLLRVSLRRLRVLWWAFSPVLDSAHRHADEAEFKRIANAAGETRDWDVLGDLLSSEKDVQNVASDWQTAITKQRDEALTSSVRIIQHAHLDESMQTMLSERREEIALHQRESSGKFAKKRVKLAEKRLASRISTALKKAHKDYAYLHQVRIAGKKLRYLLEFFGPILKGRHEKSLKRLAQFQRKLGSLNDLVVSDVLMRGGIAVGLDDTAVNKTLDWVSEQKQKRLQAARKMLRKS
jgi:CHAD domain-containing protein